MEPPQEIGRTSRRIKVARRPAILFEAVAPCLSGVFRPHVAEKPDVEQLPLPTTAGSRQGRRSAVPSTGPQHKCESRARRKCEGRCRSAASACRRPPACPALIRRPGLPRARQTGKSVDNCQDRTADHGVPVVPASLYFPRPFIVSMVGENPAESGADISQCRETGGPGSNVRPKLHPLFGVATGRSSLIEFKGLRAACQPGFVGYVLAETRAAMIHALHRRKSVRWRARHGRDQSQYSEA